jgi:hypothetical protein
MPDQVRPFNEQGFWHRDNNQSRIAGGLEIHAFPSPPFGPAIDGTPHQLQLPAICAII